MKITGHTNLVRIFELPESFSSDFCFNGGIPTVFKMVDWFNPYPPSKPLVIEEGFDETGFKGLPYLDTCENGELTLTLELREKVKNVVSNFVSKKAYAQEKALLAITGYGDSFLILPGQEQL